jgi:putative DNA primase/helicase
MSAFLDLALQYAARGWEVFPVAGKIPLTDHGHVSATSDPDKLRAMNWTRATGVACRPAPDELVLDIDPRNGGSESFAALVEKLGPLPETVWADTGSGGQHAWFKVPIGHPTPAKLAEGVDMKWHNGYVVMPGSVHPVTGNAYQWRDYCSPEEQKLAHLPPAWYFEITGGAKKKPRLEYGAPIPTGQHDTVLVQWAGKLRRDGVSTEEEILTRLRAINAAQCAPDYHPDSKVRAIAKRAMSWAVEYRRDDTGHAERFRDMWGDRARYVFDWKSWLYFDGTVWQKGAEGAIRYLAQEAIREALADATKASARPDEIKAMRSANAMRGMLYMAQGLLEAKPGDFDRDPWLLNVENGTIDLRTGLLRDHDPRDMITALAPVEYDPAAQCLEWERFLLTIFKGDRELAAFEQRWAGYCLTADTRERVFYIAVGPGANGKSTRIGVKRDILGSYSRAVAPETLMVGRQGREGFAPSPDVARLFGARYATALESEQGGKLAESLLKAHTGGGDDKLTARFLHENPFEFLPTHKIELGTNYKPDVRGSDPAVWDRILLVPHMVRFDAAPKDGEVKRIEAFKDKVLAPEYQGILAWMVRGCLDWQRAGLQVPASVKAATAAYRREQDRLQEFLDEYFTEDPESVVTLKEVWDRWKEFTDKRPGLRKQFEQDLGMRYPVAQKPGEQKKVHGLRAAGLGTRYEVGEVVEGDASFSFA